MSITVDGVESVPTTVDRNAWKALAGSALGYAMDGFDLLILGFMLRTIAADLSLSQAQSSLGSIGNRQLSKDQQGLVEQIRTFIQQAQEGILSPTARHYRGFLSQW